MQGLHSLLLGAMKLQQSGVALLGIAMGLLVLGF